MKKPVVIILLLIVIAVTLVYILIPQKLEISKIDYINCNINGSYRILVDTTDWKKWWPKHENPSNENSGGYNYNGFSFRMNEELYNGIKVKINGLYNSRIDLIKLNMDSIAVVWKCEMSGGIDPVTRLVKYYQAEKLEKSMKDILQNLQTFLDDKKNIYGINLHVIMSKDSTMVLTKSFTKTEPTTGQIYQLINHLKTYIASEKAKINNYPMLHVKKLSDSSYETMVAIPVNKKLDGNKTISFSRFVPWKVLTAEVHGGNASVENALHQMKLYISDYQRTVMAIPFQSLVTDRSKEPDTSKWITDIYVPVP